MLKSEILACIIGDSLFEVGDHTSIAQAWGRYQDKVRINESMNLKIEKLYCEMDEQSTMPKFRAMVSTTYGKLLEVDVDDLGDVREQRDNVFEIRRRGIPLNDKCLYCKAFKETTGKWKFYEVKSQSA